MIITDISNPFPFEKVDNCYILEFLRDGFFSRHNAKQLSVSLQLAQTLTNVSSPFIVYHKILNVFPVCLRPFDDQISLCI